MAMSTCKECKQQISTTAKTCPHCGAAAGSSVSITAIVYLALMGALFYWVWGLFTPVDPESSSVPAIEQAVPARTLGIKPDAFQARFNELLTQAGRPFRLEGVINSSKSYDALSGRLGEHASILAKVAKDSGEILDVTVMGFGDGTLKTTTEIHVVAAAALAAASGADYKEVLAATPTLSPSKTMNLQRVTLSANNAEGAGFRFFVTPN